MPHFLISYDLHNTRDYEPLWAQLEEWGAKRLLESLWLAELRGPATTIRDILKTKIDGDDSLAVISLESGTRWALTKPQAGGSALLQRWFP